MLKTVKLKSGAYVCSVKCNFYKLQKNGILICVKDREPIETTSSGPVAHCQC